MPVRSAVLYHNSVVLVAGVGQTLATVPTGEVWLIREITGFVISAAAGADVRFSVRIGGIACSVLRQVVATSDMIDRPGRFIVAEAGDELRATSQVAGSTVQWHVSGAALVTS